MRLVLWIWRFGLRVAAVGGPLLLLAACQTTAGQGPQVATPQGDMWRLFSEAVALSPVRLSDVPDEHQAALCPTNSPTFCWRPIVVLSDSCAIAPRRQTTAGGEVFVSFLRDGPEWRQQTLSGWSDNALFVAAAIEPDTTTARELVAGVPAEHYGEFVAVASYSADEQSARSRPARLTGIKRNAEGIELFELQVEPQPGDVGGAVLTQWGELLGVVVETPDGMSELVRYAVSVNSIRAATSGEDPICRWPAGGS